MYAVKYFNFNQQSSWASSLTDENICAALCLQKKLSHITALFNSKSYYNKKTVVKLCFKDHVHFQN